MEAYILRSFVFFPIILSCDLNLLLRPRPHAVVKEGRELELTCQSNRSGGVYWFYTVDDKGRQTELGTGGGDFKYCVNQTQLATIECLFEEPWTFKLTLLTPVHNQIINCGRTLNRVVTNSSTTIFIQVPVSKLTLSPLQTAVGDGEIINITCLTNDCRPPANITWFEGNLEITNQKTYSIQNGSNLLTKTISVLQYTGIEDDNGKDVYCRANNIDGEHVESNRYVINVAAIPTVRPDILLVECEVASAKIFWTESSDHSSMNTSLPVETFLQISSGNDTFVNCSYDKIETNKSKFHIYKVDKLKPDTKYRFKLMVSDKSDFSNIWTCITDEEKNISHKEEYNMGTILGGSVIGALFLALFVTVGVLTLYKRIQTGRKRPTQVTQSAHYVDHFCPKTDQPYQEISSNQNTDLQNIHYVDHFYPATDHLYQEVSNQITDNIIFLDSETTLERVEYMEIPDAILTNEDSHYHTLK